VSALASLRISAKCPRCELPLLAPEQSVCVSKDKTVHIWHCPMCDNQFETTDQAIKSISDDELIPDLFTTLLVA
jgi:hypothetical protein